MEELYRESYIKILDETGRGVYFEEGSGTRWDGAFKERSHLMAETDGYTWHRLDGIQYRFTAQGRLDWIKDPIGNRQTLAYDAEGYLTTVTDEASGRVLTFHYDDNSRLTHISGPVTTAVSDGIWVRYDYDTNGNLISVTYADGSGFSYDYADPNDPHNLTEKKDKLDHVLSTWDYDNQDRAIKSTTRDGQSVSINYMDDREVEITDAYGVIRTYRIGIHEGHKKVIGISEETGCATCGSRPIRYSYDDMLRVIEKEYANGAIHQYYDLDERGNPQTVILNFGTAEQRAISYTYHPDTSQKLSQIEASVLGSGNKETIWDYDDDGNDTANENPTRLLNRKIERGYTKNSSGTVVSYEYITTYQYNSKGQLLSADGPLPGNQDTTTYTYDPVTGDLLTVTRPMVGTATYGNYDAAGNAGHFIDINGEHTTYTYDGRNRVISEETNGIACSQTYNLAGVLAAATDRAGRTFSFSYDETYGYLVKATDPLGNSLRYAYDVQGNRIEEAVYDNTGTRRRFLRYDYQDPEFPGRLWKVINPDGTETVYGYDGMGNRTSVTDPLGRTTTYAYDAQGRLTRVAQPGSVITEYAYDAHGNLIRVTDAEGNVTTYAYDDAGRVLETVSPDAGTTAYAYDASGNLISKTDAKGITSTFTYDALSRLLAIYFPDPAEDITYAYDEGENGKGRLTGMTDPSGTYTYAYDALRNLTREQATIEGLTYVTKYAYDSSGVLTQMTYPDGRTVSYVLDAKGNVAGVTTAKDGISQVLAENVSHLPFGQQDALTLGNGIFIEKTFDDLYRLTHIDAGGIQDLDYVLDALGNMTAITDNLDPARDQSFSYDALNRLAIATGIYGAISYTYDQVGNRLIRTRDGETDTYTYEPGSNRLSEITGANPKTFSYDAAGNTMAMGDVALTFNQNNRLIEAATGATLGAYTYNGKGQRIKKIVGDQTILYHYDQFGNLIAESDAQGNILQEYIYLDGMLLAVVMADDQGSGSPPEDIVIDNTGAGVSFVGGWSPSTAVAGYLDTNYLYHEANGAPPGGIILDNQDGGVTFTGTWPVSTSVSGYYEANYQHHPAGSGSNSVTWTPEIADAGDYEVYIRWTTHPNRASNAKYTINYDGGSETITVNQRENGGTWNHLGTFSFAAGTSGNIVLTDEADGYVIADSVKLVPVNAEPNTAIWTPDISEAGNYKVYARWTAHPNRATNAKYSINYDGGSETVVVNQQENGGEWNLLGTFYFAADNSGSITLTDEANGYVIADAVMLRRVYQEGGAEKISVYFYHNDHLGTPQVMTDESGTVAWRADYMPFGHADVIVGAIDNNFRLPGQYQDSETGLHYNYHRYYDPRTGRYLRADPIGILGEEVYCNSLTGINFDCFESRLIGNQIEINHLYSYVENNPINYIDVTGLKKLTPKDFKDWYDKYKDAQGVYEACKFILNEKGGLKENCSMGDCHDCAKKICDTYARIGTIQYIFCLDGLFGVCLGACPCP